MLKAKGVAATKGKAKCNFRVLERRWNLSQGCEWAPGLERSRRRERTPQVDGAVEPRSVNGKAQDAISSMF